MYTKFFGFKEKPFSLVPNPGYLYKSNEHAHALTFLEYGLTEKIGFVMLTGEIGIGKTTLIRYLLNRIEADTDVAVIFNTNILSDDFIKLILDEFEIEYDNGITKANAISILYEFLIKKYAAKRSVLLVIDEAQNLSDEVLEEIRMLSNLQTDDEMLLQIMIVGQPNLRDKIQSPGLEQFAQRISVSYHMPAMPLEETAAYIAHRLDKAGGSPDLFPMDVVEMIFKASGGIPRTINLLCDAALVYGYADDKKIITPNILAQVIKGKGRMGIFTKQKLKQSSRKVLDDESPALDQIEEKIAKMQLQIDKLTETLDAHLNEAGTRAEFCRDALVSNLIKLLKAERKRCASLEYALGIFKGQYKLKKIKK